MKTAWTVVCVGILGAGMLLADTVGIVKKTCPLCATAFEAEMDMSGTSFGQRLDLKPIGPIAAPWRLAVCPRCQFVLYKDDLSDEERGSLRAFVASPEYKAWVGEKHTSYFLVAQILRHRTADAFAVADAYLQASWQVEAEPARHNAYLKACLGELRRYLEGQVENDDRYITARILTGEILRRTGDFEAADRHFRQLGALAEFRKQPYRTICEYQIELIRKKDRAPKEIPKIEMTEADIRETPGFAMLETSPALSAFTNLFDVSDLSAKSGHTFGVYFMEEQWSGTFIPKTNLPCRTMAELIFPVATNDVILVGLTPVQVIESLAEVCRAPFVREMVKGRDPGRVRLRAAGDRLHWDTEEVEKYIAILKANGIEVPPMKEWMEVILDTPRKAMISFLHPRGSDLYVVDYWLFSNPDWRKQYQKLTGKAVDDSDFPDERYCPIVDSKGTLRLIEKKKSAPGKSSSAP